MMLSVARPGKMPTNIAGMIAKYFATSLAIEKVVSAPRVMSSCLPIATTSISLVGSLSRSTMLPASLAAEVPVFIATPTSAWASAGASLVPSPVIATSLPPSCSDRIRAILSSGVASARKSSTPASSAIALAVSGLSPVIITVRMPMARSWSKRSRMPGLTMSLRWIDAQRAGGLAGSAARDDERGAAVGADPVDRVVQVVRATSATAVLDPARRPRRSRRPCATRVPSGRSTPDMRVEAENGDERRARLAQLGERAAWPRRRRARGAWSTIERPSGVSSASEDEVGGPQQLVAGSAPSTGTTSLARRLPKVMVPVLSSSRVRHVAGGLDGAAGHREHVVLHEAVHAGDADRGEQRTDRGRDEADQQGDEDHDAGARPE